MSPEQARGDNAIDRRSDLYSLGVLAYEMLTGKPVFEHGTAELTMAAHRFETPIPIARVRSDVPRALTRLVMKCLEKSPKARWSSATELSLRLSRSERSLDRG